MKKILTIISLLIRFFLTGDLVAQGSAFGIKGGPIMGFQTGSGAQASAHISYHGIAFIESLPAGNTYAFFAQAGYHKRGSARRRLRFGNFNTTSVIPRAYDFTNVSLAVGAKQKLDWRGVKSYYMVGIRGEYNIANNLEDFQNIVFVGTNTNFNSDFLYPHPIGVRNITYGLIGGAGVEFEFSDLIGGIVELTLNPDIAPQYELPAVPNVYDPVTGSNTTIPERRFINMTMELSIGFRFLRIIEYED